MDDALLPEIGLKGVIDILATAVGADGQHSLAGKRLQALNGKALAHQRHRLTLALDSTRGRGPHTSLCRRLSGPAGLGCDGKGERVSLPTRQPSHGGAAAAERTAAAATPRPSTLAACAMRASVRKGACAMCRCSTSGVTASPPG
eukprot:351703-Chlamydomonas_euryale.AAC.2